MTWNPKAVAVAMLIACGLAGLASFPSAGNAHAGTLASSGDEGSAGGGRAPAIDDRFVPGTVAFWDRERGLIAGRLRRRGIVARTVDGGRTWRVVHRTRRGRTIGVTAAVGRKVAWARVAVCVSCRDRLLRSLDGGRTWTRISKIRLEDVSFIDRNDGWGIRRVTGDRQASIYKMMVEATADGGRTWQPVGRACRRRWTYAAVARVTNQKGWAACAGEPATQMQKKVVTRTTDGASTWRRRGDPLWGGHLVGLFFTRRGHGWMWTNRDSVFRTRDGGLTWRGTRFFEPEVDFVSSMLFVNARRGYAVYRNGERDGAHQLITSRDGGRTWRVRQTWD